MLPIGLIISLVAWTLFLMMGMGLFFWALRWFPRQPWFARGLLGVFVLLGVFARQSKWAIPIILLLIVGASAFIPRKR